MIGVNINVSLSKAIYLDLPEDSKEEDIIKKAKDESILPNIELLKIYQALKQLGIDCSQLKDWDTTNVEYKVIK